MSPNSRPPLTSRIRASFEGKRSKSEVTSPTNANGFITQDPEAFRNAIDDSINSEAFQNAIAASLAQIIKPSIKDALDTLQPLVESVYSHEVLLRKTNRSVENILLRLDTQSLRPAGEATPRSPGSPSSPATPRRRRSGDSSGPLDIEQFKQSLEKNNKRTIATLAELASAVDNNNKKVYDLIKGVNGIQATLGSTKENIDSLKSYNEQSNTTTAVVQAQLDQLKADIGLIIDAVGSDLSKNVNTINEQVAEHPNLLAAHAARLDSISGDLVSLKGQADISEKVQGLSAEIEALKCLIETGANSNNENFTALGSQLGLVFTKVEAHAGTLSEIKDGNSNPEILAAVQQSNESHASHAVLLSEIKERSLNAGLETVAAAAPEGSSESIAAIQALQADLAGLKANLEAGLSSHTENLTGLGSKIEDVLSVVEGHRAEDQSVDILAAVQKSNESHASHAEALESVRSVGDHTSPAPAPISYDTNFTVLEEKLTSLHTAIESHTGSLDEIKAANSSTSREIVPVDDISNNLGDLQNGIAAIISKLDEQNEMLTEIKDDVSAEILTALHDVGQSQANHSTLLAELREADMSDEILTALHSSNESHGNHATAFEQLQSAVQASNDSHATHSTTLDEIKSMMSPDPAASAPAPAVAVDTATLEASIATLATTLEDHKATLADIKDVTSASKDSHAAHTASLEEVKSKYVEAALSGSSSTEALGAQIGTLTAALEEQKAALTEIKDATRSSNESHAAHATTLDELKSTKSLDPVVAPETGNGELTAQIGSIISRLEEQSAMLATIKETTTNSHELHTSQREILNEVKETTSGLGDFHTAHSTSLGEIKQCHSTLADAQTLHATTLGEIRDATTASNESHAAHTATLAELKTAQLRDVPAAEDAPTSDLPAMATHLASIITKLDAQSVTLTEIKEASANSDVLTAVKQNHELLTSSHELITSHTPLIDSLKAGISHDDIVANIAELKSVIEDSKTGVDAHGALVKDLHETAKSSHSELTTAIGALAIGGAAGAGATALVSKDDDDNSAEILSEVKAVRAMIETSSASVDTMKDTVTSIASQIEINTTTLTTSITTLSDELKAEIDATGTQLTESVSALSGSVQAIDITSLNSAVDGCATEVKGLTTSIEALGGHVNITTGKVDGLAEGVHFSDKGVDQLKEHLVSVGRSAPMTEGAWFKEATPKSSHEFEQIEEQASPEPAQEEAQVVEETVSEPVVEEAIKEPVAEPVTEPIVEEPVIEEPVIEEPAIEEPAIEEPAIEEPVIGEPVIEEPAIEEPAIKEPVIEEPAIEEPAIEEPVIEEPAIEKPAIKEPVIEEPAIEEPTIEEPAIEEPAIEEPVIEEPAIEEPVAEPVVEEPVSEPVVEETAQDSVAEEAATQPIAEEAVIANKGSEEAVIDDTIAEAVIAEEVAIETPTIEEASTEAVPTEVPIIEEDASNEAVSIETPVGEEPVVEQQTAKEPAEEEESQKVDSEEPTMETTIPRDDINEAIVEEPVVENPESVADPELAPQEDLEGPETKSIESEPKDVEDLEPTPEDEPDVEVEQQIVSHEVKEPEKELKAEPDINPSTQATDPVLEDRNDEVSESSAILEDPKVVEVETEAVVTKEPELKSDLPSDEPALDVKGDLEEETVGTAAVTEEQGEEEDALEVVGVNLTEDAEVSPSEESGIEQDLLESEKLGTPPDEPAKDEKSALSAESELTSSEVLPDLNPNNDNEMEKPAPTSAEDVEPAPTSIAEPELTPIKGEETNPSPTKDEFEETATLASPVADVEPEDEWAMPPKKSKKDKKKGRKSGLSSGQIAQSPMGSGEDSFDTASPLASSTEDSASGSTSAFASPSSASFPLSPVGKGKKGKKEKKEKKEPKAKKGKKEKVPFSMDGEEPE